VSLTSVKVFFAALQLDVPILDMAGGLNHANHQRWARFAVVAGQGNGDQVSAKRHTQL
jgi:hypothetical protein